MAHRREPPTQAVVDEIADRAQNFSFELDAIVRGITALQHDLLTLDAAAKINQLAHACIGVNSSLLALARIRDDKAKLETDIRAR